MKSYSVDKIRNIVLVGHGGCGKTMVAEAMLYQTKAVERFGQVDDGTSVMDHDAEEVKRKISLNTSLAPVEFEGHKINLLDTPGFFDFVGEVKAGVRVADAGLVVACAVGGWKSAPKRSGLIWTKETCPGSCLSTKWTGKMLISTSLRSAQSAVWQQVDPGADSDRRQKLPRDSRCDHG